MPLIRVARPEDIPKLGPIERSAASIFRTANLAWVADGETLPPASLADFCRDGSLWVAVTDDGELVGFLAAHELDKAFYITEVSVTTSHQRQGIGAHLINTAIEYARAAGFGVVTLMTYRDLPWNGPFYIKFGFCEVNAQNAGPGHRRKVCEETNAGHDPSRRCVMAKGI
jgi:GNAT superfamily N-acetyltransferase